MLKFTASTTGSSPTLQATPSKPRTKICLLLSFAAVVAGLLAPASAIAASDHVEGEVIVTFKPAATETVARNALSRRSLAFTRRYGWLSQRRGRQTGLVRQSKKSTAQLIAELKDDPNVESVEPNYLRWVTATPNDTRFGELWGLKNTGQTVDGAKGMAGADVKFLEAWDMARLSNQEVVVGVIDTGVDYNHSDLLPNMWKNKNEINGNGIDDDNDGYVDDYHGYDFSGNVSDPSDADAHGTHVAGTIAAAGNNGMGIVGVNYQAKIMALKVSSDGDSISTSAVIEALQYAVMMKGRGVNIVALNASYGGGGFSNSEKAAIDAAGNAGIILVAAAGNESSNNDVKATYPASYRLPNMIVVAASDQKDALASFSNYGASKVDIAAPGTKVLSAQPSSLAFKVGNATYDSSEMTYSAPAAAISGNIYDCGIGNPANFPAGVNGNIALIERGTLTFAEKVSNAMAAGAKAVVVYNNEPGSFLGTLQTPGNWIAARSISRADGLAIKAALPAAGSFHFSAGYQFMQGTSMATPHVAGAVAFAAMNFPGETVVQRVQRILSAVDTKTGLTGKVATGGRLNLAKTVDANGNSVADWMEATGVNPPTITSATTLPGTAVSEAYVYQLTASGGQSPYSWSLVSGAMPTGLTLGSSGVIQGSPTTPGTWSFAVRVKDAANATRSEILTLTVASTPLAISSSAPLPAGKVGTTYSFDLSATGGTPTYMWSVVGGSLPAGVTLSAAGKLTGKPQVAGDFNFNVRVTDGGQDIAEKALSLFVDSLPLNITTAALPVGARTTNYAQPLIVTGGVAPYSWSLAAGPLPSGVALTADGILSGTPSAFGSFPITVQVTDGWSRSVTKSFSLLVEEHPLRFESAAQLTAGVKALLYQHTFEVSGGSGSYSWSAQGQSLPPGMKVSSAGVLSGTPTQPGNFAFNVTVTDSLGLRAEQAVQLTISATYSTPVLAPITLGETTVGMPYAYTVTASNYPKRFTITKLPPGVRYSAVTGVISGRPTVAGSFLVQIKASNPGGTSETVEAPLVVKAVTPEFIGSFTGIADRESAANRNLGSRLTLTTTKTGSFTARVTTGAATKAVTGYLFDSAPHVRAMIGTDPLELSFDPATNTLAGTLGNASLSGWRSTWSAANPATSRAGYYTVALDLANVPDQGVMGIPQGTGYASITVSANGSTVVSGKTADGSAVTSSGFLGPRGEIAVYRALYGNLGSLVGVIGLTEDPNKSYTENTVSGTLTWLKPSTKTRVYAPGFGPLSLSVYGKYLAASASKGITSGLPAAGVVSLRFTDGGLAESEMEPDVATFNYTAAKTVVMPAAGSPNNPARVTLAMNKSSGLVSGTFTLVESTPKLTRRVAFQGMIVRNGTLSTKAAGYFLLPQIPLAGQTIATSPILSGGVIIEQTTAEE